MSSQRKARYASGAKAQFFIGGWMSRLKPRPTKIFRAQLMRRLDSFWKQTGSAEFLTPLKGEEYEHRSHKQRLGNCRIDCVRHVFDDGRAGKNVSQGGAARSVDRLWISRDAHRARQRHDHFSNGGELPRAFAGVDVVRCGATAGPLHGAGRGGGGGSGGAKQGEGGPGIDPRGGRTKFNESAGPAGRVDTPGDGRPPARNYRATD